MAKSTKPFTCLFKDCPASGEGLAGQEATHDRLKRGRWAHQECFDRNGRKFLPHLLDPSRLPEEEPETSSSLGVLETAIKTICQGAIDEALAGYETGIDEAKVRELIEKYAVKQIEIIRPDMPVLNMGRQHKQFEKLFRMCSARNHEGHRLNVWVSGSAGTGKSTAARKVAEALGLQFASTGSLTDCYTQIFGYVNPHTDKVFETLWRKLWSEGGVFVLDDFDGSDPIEAIKLNMPTANGHCAFPDLNVPRHPDFVLILTANTWGHGSTEDYVGRVKQDKAFIDRFVRLHWDVDEELELDTCPDRDWAKRVQYLRANVKKQGLKVLVTPRASYNGAALLAAGLSREDVENATIRCGLTDEQWSSIQ